MSFTKPTKPITVEGLGLSGPDMEKFAAGCRYLYGDKRQPKKVKTNSKQPVPRG